MTIAKVDGVDVHVEGEGPAILMLHGWPDTYRLWDDTVAALSKTNKCIRFTMPGFDPSHERRERTIHELIAFFNKVLDTVVPGQKVTLLLHDWGCVFGYQFYNRHPERVSRIVGVDIGDAKSLRREMSPSHAFFIVAYQWYLAAAWTVGGSVGDAMNRWMARRAHCPTDPKEMNSGMTYPYKVLWFRPREQFRGEIREFIPKVPMLYIYGRKKPFMFHTESWLDVLRKTPGNRVEGFDTNHWVMKGDPQKFNAVVADWLRSSSASA